MADEPRMFTFEFRGRADIRTQEGPEETEVVDILNAESDRIAHEIQQEIKRALPPSVNVETQISFYEGSITWEGIIVVLDWMARLGGAAEFVGIFVGIIRIAIDRVLRRWLSGKQSPFHVRLVSPMQIEVTLQTVGRRRRTWDTLRTLTLLTAVNTLLLLALLIMRFVR